MNEIQQITNFMFAILAASAAFITLAGILLIVYRLDARSKELKEQKSARRYCLILINLSLYFGFMTILSSIATIDKPNNPLYYYSAIIFIALQGGCLLTPIFELSRFVLKK